MKKAILIIVLGLLVVGCATVKEVYMPSGEKAYAIDCTGNALSREHCLKKAGEICKEKGYEILAYHEEETPMLVMGYPGPTKRNLKVQCKL